MPLKPLGKPPYLLPDEVEPDDIVEIMEKPYIVPAEKTKWGKDRGKAQIMILRNGQKRTWTMNNTTWDRLVADFGQDESQWVGKKVQIKKEMRNVSGVEKEVLYGRPYREPQRKLDAAEKAELQREAEIEAEDVLQNAFRDGFKAWLDKLHLDLDKLSAEQRNALMSEYARTNET